MFTYPKVIGYEVCDNVHVICLQRLFSGEICILFRIGLPGQRLDEVASASSVHRIENFPLPFAISGLMVGGDLAECLPDLKLLVFGQFERLDIRA